MALALSLVAAPAFVAADDDWINYASASSSASSTSSSIGAFTVSDSTTEAKGENAHADATADAEATSTFEAYDYDFGYLHDEYAMATSGSDASSHIDDGFIAQNADTTTHAETYGDYVIANAQGDAVADSKVKNDHPYEDEEDEWKSEAHADAKGIAGAGNNAIHMYGGNPNGYELGTFTYTDANAMSKGMNIENTADAKSNADAAVPIYYPVWKEDEHGWWGYDLEYVGDDTASSDSTSYAFANINEMAVATADSQGTVMTSTSGGPIGAGGSATADAEAKAKLWKKNGWVDPAPKWESHPYWKPRRGWIVREAEGK
ncbi:hypothetical protein A3770_20p85730 [Chloropicon primus]|uniref:Uncharacterized protein n=1 Tax=Chloropicon primus TaxID=1764295 RepID=A0A5B8N2G4_9CHLO|nr:hypothetical protein A3770_20p85730 [Chloropicon primus]|eukprot:QDZ26055.1 hypothetical protein A3770_20p85730 [Chloropicon primus]